MTNPQQYPQAAQPSQTIREPRNAFAITALILALIGIVFGIVPFTGFIAFILGGLAVLFALLHMGRVRRGVASNRKMNIFGGVIGLGAIALGIYGMVTVFTAVEELDRDLDKIDQEIQQDTDDMDAYQECVDAIKVDDPEFTAKMQACEQG